MADRLRDRLQSGKGGFDFQNENPSPGLPTLAYHLVTMSPIKAERPGIRMWQDI